MKIHLCLVAPDGYPHSWALADPLAHFQHQFERLGAQVSVGSNSLDREAVNFVFGAHLGFDSALLEHFDCVLVNLEQITADGAELEPEYIDLLRGARTVDYHHRNLPAYQQPRQTTHVVRFGHAPYLDAGGAPLEDRPIDVLFLGTMTPRRRKLLTKIAATGIRLEVPKHFVYGAERDDLIRQAKAILNISAYDSALFEQVRASVVLSSGTPMITEDRGWSHADDAWAQAHVHHFDADDPAAFFRGPFLSNEYFDASRHLLDTWRRVDVSDCYRRLLSDLRSGSRTVPALAV